MTKSVKRMDWGKARVEVTALMGEIDAFREGNHTRKTIHEMFKRQGKVTCGFSTFCRWIDRLSDEHPQKITPAPLPVSKLKQKQDVKPKLSSKSKPKNNSSPSVDSKPTERTGLRVHRPEMDRFKD